MDGVSPMAGVDRITVPKKAKTFFDEAQLQALLKACGKPTFLDRRDLAILRIFIDVGVRVSGLAGMRYHPDDESASDVRLAKRELRITLKGGDELWVRLGKRAAAALDGYLRARLRHELAEEPPWLWLGQRGTSCDHLTASGIQQMLKRRGAQAGVQGALFPPVSRGGRCRSARGTAHPPHRPGDRRDRHPPPGPGRRAAPHPARLPPHSLCFVLVPR